MNTKTLRPEVRMLLKFGLCQYVHENVFEFLIYLFKQLVAFRDLCKIKFGAARDVPSTEEIQNWLWSYLEFDADGREGFIGDPPASPEMVQWVAELNEPGMKVTVKILEDTLFEQVQEMARSSCTLRRRPISVV